MTSQNLPNRLMRATIVLVAVFLSSVIVASATGATVTWLKVNPPSSPSARASMAMAYDPVSKRVVLFGGFDATGYLNDTWVFDGQTWSLAPTPNAPSPRAASAMSFDRIAGKLVMFGGFNGSQYIGDTWIWDGVSETWTEASPSTLPTPVTLPMMFTDPKNGHAEMFGGFDGNFYQLTTWQWTGGNWINRKPATSPSARGAAIVSNDFAHNTVVLYGGLADVNPLNTWTWDGTNWTLQSPAVQPDSTYYTAAAYDPMLGEVVMFSGSSGFNTTWAWTGTNWVTVNTVNAPLARESMGMAYDNESQQLLIFGGDVPQGVMNDTYKLAKRQ